ncbi:SixA phosphatase family protein [Nigerium massiliense]|uniref:SixA phosphatase family protein n=1 Tax=Nigerium massiliense TaxID=1522317 RepID=UPI00058B99E8|nr:histidine phosphatase family protein [Nigerium massiliense]
MAGKTLLLMRHAKSSWKTNEADATRPLSGRGTRDAVVAGETLADFDIDVLLCSTASRAQQTWQCALMGGASASSVKMRDSLYAAWPEQILDEIRELPSATRTALVIGHQPAMGELIVNLVAASPLSGRVAEKFPTSAIAVLTFDGSWEELAYGDAVLRAVEVPRG